MGTQWSDRAAPRFYVRVRIKGAEPVDVTDKITAFRFEDDDTKTDKLTLSVDNYDLAALNGPLWVVGNMVEFTFGYPGLRIAPAREAVIKKVSGGMALNVECDDKAALLHQFQRTDRTWLNVKRSDVVTQILREHFPVEDLHVEDTVRPVPSVTQSGQTDLQLIRRLATLEGFDFYVDFDGPHFHKRDTEQAPLRTIRYFTGPDADVISWSFEVNDRAGKPGSITAGGKDQVTGEPFTVTADASSGVARTALATHSAVAGPKDDNVLEGLSDIGETSLSTQPASSSPTEAAVPTGQSVVMASSAASAADAQRQVDGMFAREQLRGVTLSMVIVLDPQLVGKSVVSVEGLGPKLSGNWYVKNVVHDLYAVTTSLKLAREGLNGQGAPVDAAQNKKAAPDAGGAGGSATGDGSAPLVPTDVLDTFGGQSTVFRESGGRGR
jgi:hypothetical protein